MIAVVIVLLLLAAYFMYTKSHEDLGPVVFSKELVERHAAVLCDKGDPLKNGGVYRVESQNSIAWYPSVVIADSWDLDWRKAIKVDCTGATAAPSKQLKK